MRRFLVLVALACAAALEPAQSSAGPSKRLTYEMAVELHPDQRRMDVRGTLEVPIAKGSTEISFILFNLASDLRLQVRGANGALHPVELKTVQRRGRSTTWSVPVPTQGVGVVKYDFTYSASGDHDVLYYVGPDLAFATGWGALWYPVLTGDDDKSTGSLTIVKPAGWRVVTGDELLPDDGQGQARVRIPITRPNYFSFAAGPYQRVHGRSQDLVSALVLKARPALPDLMDGMGRVVNALEREFGPRAFRHLTLVEVPRNIAQASGFNAGSPPGFLLVNGNAFGVPKIDNMTRWIGHETAHQWFPHKLSFATPPGLFMEEALAEYGGQKVVEALMSEAVAERSRRTGYEYDPIYSAAHYFALVRTSPDAPFGNLPATEVGRNLAYNKGFFIFAMLSDEVGAEAMRRAWRKIIAANASRKIPLAEFEAAMARSTGRDLRWFFSQWFERTGAPTYELTWQQKNGLLDLTISQPGPYYRATLEIDAIGQTRRRTYRVVADGAVTRVMLPIDFSASDVVLDPRYRVLRWPSPGDNP